MTSDSASEQRWTVASRTDAIVTPWMRLVDHDVRLPDGSARSYLVDETVPYAAAVLVVDGDAVILTRQYRHPLGRWIHDLPGGGPFPGETPEQTARRELEEEVGLVAADLTPLCVFAPNPGRSSWLVHLFAATGDLAEGAVDLSDPAEQVRPVRMPIAELDDRIASGDIIDATLLIARGAAARAGVLPPIGSVDTTPEDPGPSER